MYPHRKALRAAGIICQGLLKICKTTDLGRPLLGNKICGSHSRRLYLYSFSFVYHKSIVMEQQQDSSIFGMNVDQAGKSHLAEAARWAKFISVIGFIVCAMVVLYGAFFRSIIRAFPNAFERNNPYGEIPDSAPFRSAIAFIYVVVALIYFFPFLFLFRFATKMKTALASNDQETLNTSFQNLKATFRFVGILLLIGLCFWALAIVVALIGAAAGGGM